MPLNRSLCSAFGCLVLFVAAHANATTITTTDFNTWKTSDITGSATELNFYPVSNTSYNTAAGITLSPTGSSLPFVFTGPNNGSFALTGDGYGKALLGGSNSGSSINISLPTGGENAVFLAVSATASKPTTIVFSDGEIFSVTSTFFGAALSQPVSWIRISTVSGSQPYINDLLFGTSALPQDGTGGPSTPEPGTLLLCLAGGAMVYYGSRRARCAG
jgi:hypothetical protein